MSENFERQGCLNFPKLSVNPRRKVVRALFRISEIHQILRSTSRETQGNPLKNSENFRFYLLYRGVFMIVLR